MPMDKRSLPETIRSGSGNHPYLNEDRPLRSPFRKRRALLSAVLAAFILMIAAWGALHLVPLPAGLDRPPVASVLLTDVHGEILRELPVDGHYTRPPLSFDQIPLSLRQATIAAEDRRFYSHVGVDPLALIRAAIGQFGWRRSGERRSGGSTITEQLIKLSCPRPRTLWTKLVEAVQALRLEQVWTKEQIFTAYLNRLDYGNRDLGCAAAARHYFGKRAADLSTAEAALLAALPQSPTRLNPFRHLARARARQQWILQRMDETNGASADELARARVEPLRFATRARPFDAPHFIEHLLAGGGRAALLRAADARGEVRTTLDLELNRFITDTLLQHLAGLRAEHVGNGAVVVIDNRTGGIIALVGSADFFSPHGGQIDGAWARRSPGSTIKPFTYLLAFERGATPADVVGDLPVEFPSRGAIYKPENYSHRFYGPMRLRPALANSLNISAVKVLADKAGGPPALLQRLRDCGVTTLPLSADHYGLGLTLGNSEARLLELTNAYACLARLGDYLPCQGFLTRSGSHEAVRLADPRSTYLIADILADNGARALSFGVDSDLHWDFPVACKTGTSTDFRDNWAIGYTPEFTVGVWVGNFDGRPMIGVSGVTGAGPLLHQIFERLHIQRGTSWYTPPAGIVERVVHRVTGHLLDTTHTDGPDAIIEKFAIGHLPIPEQRSDYDGQGRVRLSSEYANWLASGDNWLAGQAVAIETTAPPTSSVSVTPAGIASDSGNSLSVVSPIPGTTYVLDPDLPVSSRLLDLRVKGCANASWESDTLECRLVNGQAVAVLREGHHTLRVQDPINGHWRRRGSSSGRSDIQGFYPHYPFQGIFAWFSWQKRQGSRPGDLQV